MSKEGRGICVNKHSDISSSEPPKNGIPFHHTDLAERAYVNKNLMGYHVKSEYR